MKVFKVPKEENHTADIVAKLAVSRTVKMSVNVFMEVAKASYIEGIMVGTLEEKKDWQTLIL